MAAYTATVASLVAARRATRRALPAISLLDVGLMSVATFKLSRLLTKASVTRPLRAPFTEVEQAAGEAELNERPRGSGLRHVAGELASCPFCASVWIGTGLAGGLVFAPRFTRLAAAAATAVAGADFLQLAWSKARQSARG
jgi:hypothetical protein